jgi:hypothetical protein
MDIYSFINSKDVAAHCREIKHEFTALEQAVIVRYSHKGFDGMHEAWQWIIDNLPDEPIHKEAFTYNSLHKFLHDYMALINRITEDINTTQTYNWYVCPKCNETLCESTYLYRKEDEDLFDAFDGYDMEAEFPVPFKKGDIVSDYCYSEVWGANSKVGDSRSYKVKNIFLEYSEEPKPSLLALSNYLKENISVDLLLNAHGVHVFKNRTRSTCDCDISRFAATDAPPLPEGDFADIYSYIPSRDIAAHCRELQHEFNPLEQAFIVYLSDKTLAEKHEAWQKIIDTLPDMEVPENCDCPHYDSLHRLLQEYMALENQVVEMFKADEPNVAYGCGYGDDSWLRALLPTWKSLMEFIREESKDDDEFEMYRVRKQWIDGWGRKLEAKINSDGIVIGLDNFYYEVFDSEGKEHGLAKRFADMWMKIPVPFKDGDIVMGEAPFYSVHEPFVFSATGNRGSDTSDMTAYGYWLDDDGGIYWECMHAYQNLEYYRGELTGRHRILKAISSHIKGELPVDELLNAYEVILHEEQAKSLFDRMKFDSSEFELRLVGLGSEVKVVGLFWYIPDEDRLIVEKFPIDESDLDSNHVTAKSAHFLVWEKYKDEYKCDYKHYPRGRVNYIPKKDEYELDMDSCLSSGTGITPYDAVSRRIAREFGIDGRGLSCITGDLSNQTTANGRHEGHYSCYQCRGRLQAGEPI